MPLNALIAADTSSEIVGYAVILGERNIPCVFRMIEYARTRQAYVIWIPAEFYYEAYRLLLDRGVPIHIKRIPRE